MIEIPTLKTERLILRAPKFEDLEPMEGFFANPVHMKFLEGPIKRGDVWTLCLEQQDTGRSEVTDFGISKIEKRESCADTRAF